MMEQGLAQQQAMGQQMPQEEQMLQQIVELLMQGVTPEELIQKGVPQELVQKAMMIIQQQQQPQPEQAGLAGRATQGGL